MQLESTALLALNPLGPIVTAIHGVLAFLLFYTRSYGWALVLFAALVKLVFWPLNTMQFKATLKMQKLAPQLKDLQLRYGKDKVALNAATLALYETGGTNPFASCLPPLVQLPIIASVYWAILRDRAEFAQQSWLWIGSDVARHAPYGALAANLAVPDYALLLLYMGSMYLQARYMTPGNDPQQAQQRNIMSVISPLMIGYLGYKYQWPSALIIYWFSYNAFTIGQQFYLVRKYTGQHSTKPVAKANPLIALARLSVALRGLVYRGAGLLLPALGFRSQTLLDFRVSLNWITHKTCRI